MTERIRAWGVRQGIGKVDVGLLAIAVLLACSALAWASDAPPEHVRLPMGFVFDREISVGNIAVGLTILVQVGRWGRKSVARFADLPERIDRLERRYAEMLAHMTTLRCVREHTAACPEDDV